MAEGGFRGYSSAGNIPSPIMDVETLNSIFQESLRGKLDTTRHLFFESFAWWQTALKSWKNRRIPPDVQELEGVKGEEEAVDCRYVPQATMTPDRLDQLYSLLQETDSFDSIRSALMEMYDFNLPSTVSDPERHFEDDTINILVVGAGPVGLFTSLYLMECLEQISTRRKYRLLLIDNRVDCEGVRRPYTRLTQFGFDVRELIPFIPRITYWKRRDKSNRHFDFISVLENILFLVAFHRKVPMYFTRLLETMDAVRDFARRKKIRFILDCSGGRLRKDIPSITWDRFSMTSGNKRVAYNEKAGVYQLEVDGRVYSHTTLVLRLLDKRMRELPTGNLFGHPSRKADIQFIKQNSGKCFTTATYINLSRNFSGKSLRCLFPTILYYTGLKLEQVAYVQVYSFDTTAHHAPSAAEMIDPLTMYVALGNTLGTSEYGIHFGLRTAINFSKHISHLIAATVTTSGS